MRRQNPETPLYKMAIELAAANGYVAWRENTGRRAGVSFGFKGKPDIAGFHKTTGRALYWECKHENTKRRLTMDQWSFLWLAHGSGCHVRVITNEDVYDLNNVPEQLRPKVSVTWVGDKLRSTK